ELPGRGDQWQGGFAQWEGWSIWAFTLADTAPYDWALGTLPMGPANNLAFAQGHLFAVPSNAPDPDKSWVFLEWLLTQEGQAAIVALDKKQPISNDSELWELYFSSLPAEKQDEVR